MALAREHRKSGRALHFRRASVRVFAAGLLFFMVVSFASLTRLDILFPHDADVIVTRARKPTAERYEHLDKLDPLPPRPGESFITFDVFLDCLAARLRVDRHQQRELPISDDEPHFPYLVSIVTFELRELKAFMCNVTVPAKRLMLVRNFNLESVTEFLNATTAAFAFTDRFQIRHFPRNLGYSGALNVAMQDALRYSFDEVPFFFMSNMDIRFTNSVLEEALPRFRTDAFAGKPLLEAFRAEVATEPNEYTPPHFRAVPLRSTDGRHLLRTSPSLPDRVRYMNVTARRAVFSGLHGYYFPDCLNLTDAWALSRLAMETVGFFDANCYPAYEEDGDYRARLELLGLRSFSPLPDVCGVHHAMRNLRDTEDANARAATLGDTLPLLRGVAGVLDLHFSQTYSPHKKRMAMTSPNTRQPLDMSLLPLDAWVLNEKRRLAIEELVLMNIRHYSQPGVNVTKRDLRTIIAPASAKHQDELIDALEPYVNMTELYRDGNALRPLLSPM